MLWDTQTYPTDETAKLDPQYPYALTKKLGEDLVLHFSKVYNLNATSLRFLMYTVPGQGRQVLMVLSLVFF